MGIRAVNLESTLQSIDITCRKATEALISTFAYVGEACVREARLKANFRDQTGNLRSSIGYVLLYDGKVVQNSDFSAVKGGSEGSTIGAEFAKKIGVEKAKNKGVTLIVVAGMNYATHVVARGYDVLDSAEILAKQIVPKMLSKLKI